MADRTVSVELKAQIGDLVSKLSLAGSAVDAFNAKVQGAGKSSGGSFKAVETSTTAATTAVVDYGKASDKATLSAQKMGVAARAAADKAASANRAAAVASEKLAQAVAAAEAAQQAAAVAAGRLADGEIKAAEAKRLEADATRKADAAEQQRARTTDIATRAVREAERAEIAEAAAASAGAAAHDKQSGSMKKSSASASGTQGWMVSLVAAAVGVAPAVIAAGLAFGAFAAVAAPSVMKVVKAQKDLSTGWSTLDAGQRATSANLTGLVGQYKALSSAYEPQALSVFNGLIGDTSVLMQRARPLMDAGAQGMTQFTSRIDSFVTGGTMQRFLNFEATQAGPALDKLGQGFAQTGTLALNLTKDLSPMGMTLLSTANTGLRFLNTVEQISPHLAEAGVAALALKGPTQALSDMWTNSAPKVSNWASKTAEADGKLTRLAKGALSANSFLGKLGRTISAAPSLYIGAGLAAVYLAQRLSSMKDSTTQLIDSVKVENNAFGNNAAGHLAAAKSLSTYIAQERAATQAATQGMGDMRDRQHVTTVYSGEVKKLTAARQAELTAANNITTGEKDLANQYGFTGDEASRLRQANQLATAAGVDLSKGITGNGAAAQAARAKMEGYRQSVLYASDSTRVISDALSAAGNNTLALKDRMAGLTNAWNAMAGPAISAFDSVTKQAQGFAQLDAALKKSHGSLSQYTAAGQNARGAFAQLYTTLEQNIQAQYQYDSVIKGVPAAAKAREANARRMVPLLLAEAHGNKTAEDAVLRFAQSNGIAANSVQDLVGQMALSKSQFLSLAHNAGIGKKAAEDLWGSFQKLSNKPAILRLDDAEFLSKLHSAQGLRVDPKTGLLLGNNSNYFNSWLKANGLRINPKTGMFRGNNADYYNKWLKANGLRINPKTGQIKGNTSAFWAAVHAIPSVVGQRTVTVTYSYQGSGGNKQVAPAQNRADGGIDRYGDGGMRRDMDAFAVAKPTVLFGETSTGGEAYIPLGSQKRQRSTMLLSDVAGMFGMQLVKPMADGGIMSFANGGTTSSTTLDLGSILQTWTDTVKPASKTDVTSAIKSRKTQVDQLKSAEDALYKARHAHNRDARTIAAAERRVAKERGDVADATKKLHDVEARYRYARQSPATQLGSALGLGIKNTAAFIKNLTTLSDRGFGTLAQQLLAMGGTQAEKIAADAVKFSNAKLGKLQGQVTQSQQQQDQLANLPAILATRSAIKAGKGGSWVGLLNATGLTPDVLAIAVKSMLADLGKTSSGRALIADMHAHGYAHGGPIGGVGGSTSDSNLIRASRGEYMVNAASTARYRPWVEAINSDRLGEFVRHLVSGGSGGRASAATAPAASSGPTVPITINAQHMEPAELARAVGRETAWALG